MYTEVILNYAPLTVEREHKEIIATVVGAVAAGAVVYGGMQVRRAWAGVAAAGAREGKALPMRAAAGR